MNIKPCILPNKFLGIALQGDHLAGGAISSPPDLKRGGYRTMQYQLSTHITIFRNWMM
ncbi:hypothetical protein HY227_02005 [Candidatus Wolfebacteria bacterium]|nr:hypothetical protein [Candidatus Wolfebacteria bacterium]